MEKTPVVNACDTTLASCIALKDTILKGLDREAEAVKVQATFVDRAIAGTLSAVQNDFHLVPKFVIIDGESAENKEHTPIEANLGDDYFAAVNT